MTSGLLARTLDSGPLLGAGDWALGDAALELVLGEVAAGRERVVECGSGRSTVLLARQLRELARGTVHALEHDPGWAALARARIAAEGLSGRATVIQAPLEPEPLAAPGSGWYARSALRELPDSGIDLLLVDGPPASPGTGHERSRYPALPLLASRLAPGATVVLDDAQRSGERWVLERWRRELGRSFRPADGGVAVARWRDSIPPRAAEMYVQADV